jgi:hypothetical protein
MGHLAAGNSGIACRHPHFFGDHPMNVQPFVLLTVLLALLMAPFPAAGANASWTPDPEITAQLALNPSLIQEKLESSMRKLLNNPATLTVVVTHFSAEETSRGHLAKVAVTTRRGNIDNLILDHADIDFEDVQLDTTKLMREEKIDPLEVKTINMDVILREADLNTFLIGKAASIKVTEPRVTLKPGKIELSGATKYGFVKAKFWAEGNFSVKDSREIWFHARRMKINSLAMPRAFIGSLVKKINPVLNLAKFPFKLNLSEIRIEPGALHFTSFQKGSSTPLRER